MSLHLQVLMSCIFFLFTFFFFFPLSTNLRLAALGYIFFFFFFVSFVKLFGSSGGRARIHRMGRIGLEVFEIHF